MHLVQQDSTYNDTNSNHQSENQSDYGTADVTAESSNTDTARSSQQQAFNQPSSNAYDQYETDNRVHESAQNVDQTPKSKQQYSQDPYYKSADQPYQNQPFSSTGAYNGYSLPPKTAQTLAMVSYWSGIIGIIICACCCDKKDVYTKSHINQAIVLTIASLICGVLMTVPFISWIGCVLEIVVVIMMIAGTLDAHKGTYNPLPVIGDIHVI